jgi:hypothetical protein
MKSILPFLSIAGLAAILLAVTAAPRLAGGQDAASIFDEWDEARETPSESVGPYRAAAEPEAAPAIDFTQQANGDVLIAAVVERIQRHTSLFARLQHQASIDGEEFSGSGTYWQQGRDDELQVYLELQISGLEASFLQVNTGRKLWIDRRLPSGRTIASYNLGLLRMEDRPSGGSNLDLGGGRIPAGGWVADAHDGGLPGLFASLANRFRFLRPQAMRLSLAPPLVEQPKEVAVYAVVGHWKPEKLAALVGQRTKEGGVAEESTDKGSPVPEHYPAEVLLLIGQQDLFPYWIEYRHLETPDAAGADASRPFYHLSASPMVVLKFADVAFNVPVAAGQFDYAPPANVDWSDQTGVLIQRMRKERQTSVAGGDRDRPVQR